MAMQDIRKLAHEMLEELDEEAISEVIRNIRSIKDKRNRMPYKYAYSAEDPSSNDLKAIQKAKIEFQNGEFLTHEDIFGEEDYV